LPLVAAHALSAGRVTPQDTEDLGHRRDAEVEAGSRELAVCIDLALG
jgi:hypothetical protein